MKVLLVAPSNKDLPNVNVEIQEVLRSGLDVTPLLGNVTAVDLLREIRAGDYDVLWLATHGDNHNIHLSSGVLLPATELVPQVRGRFRLVVLNTCNGLGAAQMLQEEANVGVICALTSVDDSIAYKFGVLLATALVEQSSIAEAYLSSKAGHNTNYLYLPALRPQESAVENLLVEMRDLKNVVERQRSWERKATYLALALHPITWLIIAWIMWRV